MAAAKFNPPLHACLKPCTPSTKRQCCHALGHCPREDLLIEHEKTKQKQTQHPSSPLKLHGKPHPSSGCLSLFLASGPTPRTELIGATGRVTLSLAGSSWRQISYFGSGRRERSWDHPAAALRSSPGSVRESTGRAGSRDECPATLPAHRHSNKGEV